MQRSIKSPAAVVAALDDRTAVWYTCWPSQVCRQHAGAGNSMSQPLRIPSLQVLVQRRAMQQTGKSLWVIG